LDENYRADFHHGDKLRIQQIRDIQTEKDGRNQRK
jgi:hypothetical protein